jgi:hypothetical protein
MTNDQLIGTKVRSSTAIDLPGKRAARNGTVTRINQDPKTGTWVAWVSRPCHNGHPAGEHLTAGSRRALVRRIRQLA